MPGLRCFYWRLSRGMKIRTSSPSGPVRKPSAVPRYHRSPRRTATRVQSAMKNSQMSTNPMSGTRLHDDGQVLGEEAAALDRATVDRGGRLRGAGVREGNADHRDDLAFLRHLPVVDAVG